MSKSLIPTAPGFETPLEMIEACHERLQAQLETLSRLLAWLPEHGVDRPAQQAAAQVLRYFDIAGANHHRDEECDLLPLLRQRVDARRRHTLMTLNDWILADHEVLDAEWQALRAVLEPMSRGEAVALDAARVEAFAARYRWHIDREEEELLPIAREILSPDDLLQLSRTMSLRRLQPGYGAPPSADGGNSPP